MPQFRRIVWFAMRVITQIRQINVPGVISTITTSQPTQTIVRLQFQLPAKPAIPQTRTGSRQPLVSITNIMFCRVLMLRLPTIVLPATTEITTAHQIHVLPAIRVIITRLMIQIIQRLSFQPLAKTAILRMPGNHQPSIMTNNISRFIQDNTMANGMLVRIATQILRTTLYLPVQRVAIHKAKWTRNITEFPDINTIALPV